MGIAIGIPFGILVFFLIFSKAFYALGLIAVLFLLTYFFILLVWGGKYEVGFEMDRVGIHHFTLKNQSNKNLIINTLVVISGLVSSKPAAAGAGMLAQSRQNIFMRWDSVRKVKFYPKTQMVMIRAGYTENIAIFCTAMNYSEVESFIRFRLREREIPFSSS